MTIYRRDRLSNRTPWHESRLIYRYTRKFAYLPTKLKDGTHIWLKNYYEKHNVYLYETLDKEMAYYSYNLSIEDATVERLRGN